MKQILKYFFCLNAILTTLAAGAQTKNPAARQPAGFDLHYHFLHSANPTADKDFYLLTVIGYSPEIKNILSSNPILREITDQRIAAIKQHAADTVRLPSALLNSFKWAARDSAQLMQVMADLYASHQPAIDRLINQHLRASGYYQRFAGLPNQELWLKAWNQYLYGTNYIIDQFGLGKKMRYPIIDSASYVVTSKYYETVLKDMLAYLNEQTDQMQLFYQPTLAVALQLMDANDRDEPGRHEPLELNDNRAACAHIKQINFNKYAYAAILIPGNGPVLRTTPVSPDNKIHCNLAAMRYLKGLAPLIITSGGYCYPFQGPYCEAIEMKKYLMKKFAIPENAIIIDPQARHTTTNIRNANRLMIRYGIPVGKPSLFVTSKSQTDYSANPNFDKRNLKELGYLPYHDKKRISDHDIVFYPTVESLHMDPYDPLDP